MIDFIIQKAGGGAINLYSKNSATLSTITSAEQTQGLNSDDIVRITVESAVKIAFDIGDKMNILGRWYKINRLPTVKKTGNRLFTYNIELEGVQYDLARVVYDLTIDTTSNALQDVQADMLTGNLQRFATVLIANANRVFPGKWVLGDFPAGTEDKTLVFGETDNCLLVLQRLCSEYNTEFEIIQAGDVNTLHFRKAGQIYPYTFEYGKGKGLYSLERLNVSTSNIVTRLKVYGGTRNITAKYRAARLCLPGKTKGQSYIQKTGPANNYGIWEATKIFEHIYPKRTGTVTAIDSGNVLKLTDSTMNFDLNEKEADGATTKYLIEGSPAKIHFNTGNLSGYEFEIQSYDHATKTFTLKPFEDERGERFPSEKSSAFKFAVNDKYVLLDIALPQSYIDDAEEQLAEEGDLYYDQNSQPKVQYSLEVAEEFLKELSGAGSITNIFSVGDYIPVKDADIDVDKSVRVQSFTRDLLNPFSYKLNISDTVSTSITNRVISELIEIDKITKINDIKSQVKARRDWRSAQELLGMIFDVEGNYYTEKIKPNSIETQMLSVGAKSQQFGLVGTVIQANYNGNKNSVNVKGGVLSHYTIEENGRDWNLADNTTTLTGDSTPYYIYAKCQKVGTAGSIIFSTSKITVDEDPSFYHFLIGVVNSVDTALNARSVALTYGFTTVNGRFVRTGRIQSNDGKTYFDLDLGEIGGKITFRSTGGTDEDLAEILDGVAGAIQDAQSTANSLKDFTDTAFRDGIIDRSESIAIETYINQINKEKSDLEAVYNKLYVNPLLTGTPKTNLLNAKITMFGDIDSLISTINAVILDGKVTPTEKQSVDAAFASYQSSLSVFRTRIEEANQSVQQYLKGEADGARAAAAAAEAAANAASQDVTDLSGIVNNLDAYVDGAFHDGVVEEAEAKAIETYINQINSEKASLEATYNKLYLNSYLSGTPKTNLLNAKVTYFGSVDNLIASINGVIADGKVTSSEKQSINAIFATYRSDMAMLSTRIEEANKAIQDYLKSNADTIDAKVNTVKAITDKFGVTIDGALIQAVIMLLREANTLDVTAGISGIQGSLRNNPSYWSGGTYAQAFALIEFLSKMSAGTTPSAGEYSNLAKIIMLHNGAGKYGDLIVEPSGRVVMVDPATGKSRLVFGVENIPTVAALLAGTVYSGSTQIGAGSTTSLQTLSGSVQVTKYGASATFNGTSITIQASGRAQANGFSSFAVAELYAYRNGVKTLALATAMVYFPLSGSYQSDQQTVVVPTSTSFLTDDGTYTFQLEVITEGDIAWASATSTASAFSWLYTLSGVRKQQYGLDGMMFYYSDRHFHYTEGGGLDLRGPTNMPGVLLSASVASTGGFANSWGAKKHGSLTATKQSTGTYAVYHNVGHTNYQVSITPASNRTFYVTSKNTNYFMVYFYTNASTPALSDTDFDFMITGNNYSQ